MFSYMYSNMSADGCIFFDRLKLCFTAALDCRTGQNKGRYCEKELSFLLVSLLSQTTNYLLNIKLACMYIFNPLSGQFNLFKLIPLILPLCLVIIQAQFIIKSRLQWRARVLYCHKYRSKSVIPYLLK